jgi:dipeptidyl aminopeptidase/acylaminoacyl peptidase
LIFARGSTLYATPFDDDRLTVSGDPVQVAEGIQTGMTGAAQFSYADTGTMAYLPGSSARLGELVWVNTLGEVEPLGFPPQNFTDLRLSPDGQRLAAAVSEAQEEIWIYDLESGIRRRFAGEGNNGMPLWTPDGREIWFVSDRGGSSALYRAPVDESADAEKVELPDDIRLWAPNAWSPDGRMLVFMTTYPGDLMLLDMDSGEVRPFLATEAPEWGASVSPDGKWVAYTSEASGNYELRVQPFPDGGRTWTISSTGSEVVWSPRGNGLYIKTPDFRWLVAKCTTNPGFTHDPPRDLFQIPAIDVGYLEWTVDPEGDRILLHREFADENPSVQPHLIINFDEELRRLVPTEGG